MGKSQKVNSSGLLKLIFTILVRFTNRESWVHFDFLLRSGLHLLVRPLFLVQAPRNVGKVRKKEKVKDERFCVCDVTYNNDRYRFTFSAFSRMAHKDQKAEKRWISAIRKGRKYFFSFHSTLSYGFDLETDMWQIESNRSTSKILKIFYDRLMSGFVNKENISEWPESVEWH